MVNSVRANLLFLFLLTVPVFAQVPEMCIEKPRRDNVCEHLLYKRSPVSIEQLKIKEGDMVCLCMADYQPLRIPIKDGIAATQQLVELKRAARDLGVEENALAQLIRD